MRDDYNTLRYISSNSLTPGVRLKINLDGLINIAIKVRIPTGLAQSGIRAKFTASPNPAAIRRPVFFVAG